MRVEDSMGNYVMITGATGGLGKAFAVECAARGWDLYLSDLRPAPLSLFATALWQTYGINVEHSACDLTDAGARDTLFASLAAQSGRFSAVINVAGGDSEGLFREQPRDRIRAILRLNVESAVEMTHAIVPLRDPTQTFHVINVASLAAFYPMPYKATYAASKRFLLDFSLALREELAEQNVTVTVLCPAGMPTTPECIAAIEAQGLWGQLTTQNTGAVAAGAVDAALRGRAVYVPGRLNRVLQLLGSLVPPAVVARLVARRWQAAGAHSRLVLQSTHYDAESLRLREPHGRPAAFLG
jgi:uncharacterized protein